MVKLVFPDEWRIRVYKKSRGKWVIEYTEIFYDRSVFEKAVPYTKYMMAQIGFKDISVGDNSISCRMEAPLPVIAGAIVGEFILQGGLGELNLAELLFSYIAGMRLRVKLGEQVAEIEVT